MATNRAFQDETTNTATTKQSYTIWVCPACGKTAHKSRHYCDCHARLAQAKARITEEPPEVDQCNFETAGLTCAVCPEDCKWCASFGVDTTNGDGFGGKGCRFKKNDARCHCCQNQVKLAADIGKVDFRDLMGSMNSESFYKLADYINSEMKAPVLARIQHAREKAG